MPRGKYGKKKAYKKKANYKRKYNPRVKKNFVKSRAPVTETKQRVILDQTSGQPELLLHNEGDETTLPATTVICPRAYCSAWHQGYGDNQMIGRKIFLKYLNVKVELDFSAFNRSLGIAQQNTTNPDHLLSLLPHQFNFAFGWSKTDLSCHLKNTIEESYYNSTVASELVKAGFGGKFLEFREKNRGIITLGKWKIRLANKNNEFMARMATDMTEDITNALPARDKVQYSLKFPIMRGAGIKAQTVPGNTATDHFINRNYIPWYSISAPSLAGEHGLTMPNVLSLGKIWYSDS